MYFLSKSFFTVLPFIMIIFFCLITGYTIPTPLIAKDKVVNIYSYRQPHLVKEILEDFTKKTGIKTNIVFAKKGLIQRIAIEGKKSPVDILLSTDVGLLDRASHKHGQTVSKTDLPEMYDYIPSHLRDPHNKWFALTQRARVIYASKKRVKDTTIFYEDLAKPKWKNRICIRDGQHVYNLGLFASSIIHRGTKATKNWLKKLKHNLARKPSGNDRAQVKSIYAGQCDISIGNTYYMGLMQKNIKNPEQQKWAKNVRLIFSQFKNGGTHVNISGIMLAKYAPHKKEALSLMRYLISQKAQKIYAQKNHEYPVRKDVMASDIVRGWGDIHPDKISLKDIANKVRSASLLVDETQFNQ